MIAALLSLATEEAEPSKTAFYIVGGGLAAYAVLLSALGMAKPDFPGSSVAARATMAVSVLFVLAALAAVVATS